MDSVRVKVACPLPPGRSIIASKRGVVAVQPAPGVARIARSVLAGHGEDWSFVPSVLFVHRRDYANNRTGTPRGVVVVSMSSDTGLVAVGNSSTVHNVRTAAGRSKFQEALAAAVSLHTYPPNGFRHVASIRTLQPDLAPVETAVLRLLRSKATAEEFSAGVADIAAAVLGLIIPDAEAAVQCLLSATAATVAGTVTTAKFLTITGVNAVAVPTHAPLLLEVAAKVTWPPRQVYRTADDIAAHRDAVQADLTKPLGALQDQVEWISVSPGSRLATLHMAAGATVHAANAVRARLLDKSAIDSGRVGFEPRVVVGPPVHINAAAAPHECVFEAAWPLGIVMCDRGKTFKIPLSVFSSSRHQKVATDLVRKLVVGQLAGPAGALFDVMRKMRTSAPLQRVAMITAAPSSSPTGVAKTEAGKWVRIAYGGVSGDMRDLSSMVDRMSTGRLQGTPMPCVGGMFGHDNYGGRVDKSNRPREPKCPYAWGDERINSNCAPGPANDTPGDIWARNANVAAALDIEDAVGTSRPPCMQVKSLSGMGLRMSLAANAHRAWSKTDAAQPARKRSKAEQ